MDTSRDSFKVPSDAPRRPFVSTTNLETADPIPRFLIVKKIDNTNFSTVSPFVIDKIVYGLAGQVKQIKKIKEGLLIETVSTAQSLRLQKIEKFGDFTVIVIPHKTLNYSKGIVTCRDLLNCEEDEILENLKSAGVINVKRITTIKNNMVTKTTNLILTFNSPRLPISVKAAFYFLKVRPYIPAPMRCFKCQRFGHTSSRCDRPQVCVCGLELHEGSPCQTPINCVNCGGEHSAKSKTCPIYQEEMAAQRVKVENNISINEARQRIKENVPKIQTSYAQATKSTPRKELNDVVIEMIPQITEICVKILKDTTGNINNIQDQKQKSRSEATTRQKQLKHEELGSNAESSENELTANTSKTQKQAGGKRKNGRPRKPPNEPSLNQLYQS